MPLVQVYKCPRTRKLIEDKAKYITHLKRLARENLRDDDNHFRARLLKEKFDQLRRTARSLDDVAAWCMSHQRIIEHLSIRCAKLHAKPERASDIEQLMEVRIQAEAFSYQVSNERSKPLNGVFNRERDFSKPMHYPGVTFELIFKGTRKMELAKVLESFTGMRLENSGWRGDDCIHKGTLFAEDWAFAGAYNLHILRYNDMDDKQARILKHCFPSMPVDQYLSFKDSGLLPDSPADFLDFMLNYTEAIPKVLRSLTQSLPSDMVTSD